MISIKFFSGLPLEYESFLIKKYDSFITTCRYIEVNYPDYDINYSTVSDDGELIELLVYGNRGNTARCFNSLTSIDQSVIFEFTKNIFIKHPSITKIEIEASYQAYSLNKSFLNFKSNDQILELPSTLEDYYNKIGSSTRSNARKHKNKLLRDYPQVKFTTKFGREIENSIIDRIFQLNKDRMESKGTIYQIDETFKNHTYLYSQYYGCVAYIEIDGVIVAGSIATILKTGVFSHVIAHDNNYSKYNVGELCMLFLVETSIENRMSTLHFLWGESDYKKRLLAKHHELYFYYIYKSYSIDYIVTRSKILIYNTLIKFERSKFTKSLRQRIKSYRIKKWMEKS